MSRIHSVVANDLDMVVVLNDGTVFFLVSPVPAIEGLERARWVEGPPVPRTEAAGRRTERLGDHNRQTHADGRPLSYGDQLESWTARWRREE